MPVLDSLVIMHTDSPRVADDIATCLLDSICVHLTGLHGAGRTWVAARVADRLREQGVVITFVRGVAALRDRPLAVLAVAGVDIAAGAGLAIPRAVESLSALLPAGRSALVIDDADDLDPASAGVVAAVHAATGAPVLAVTRPAGSRRSGHDALTDSLQPGVRLRLDPLGFDQVHQLVHDLLPGPVDPAAVSQIATLSGGLPGLVRAIVDVGRRTGAITRQGTVWRAKGILWDARLAHAVEPLLGDLDEDESDALSALAQVGTATGAQVDEIVPPAAFRRLNALGLLEVADTPTVALVGVFPPLLAVYLRRTAGSGSRWAAPPEASRSIGDTVIPGTGEWWTRSLVAVLNTRIVEHWRGRVGTLRSAWHADPTPENAVPLLSALNEAAAGPEEFEAVFVGTRRGALDTLADAQLARWEALYRGVLLREVDAARAALAEMRAAAPQFAASLRASEATLCLAAGIMPDDTLLVADGPGDDSVTAATLDQARRTVMAYAGRTADAREGLPDAGAELSSCPESVRATVVLARVFDGDLDVGIAWARREMVAAADRLDAGQLLQYAYIAGFGLMFAGRLDEAQALLDPALALTGPTMMYGYYHTGVLGLAALAACWRGQQDYCEALRAQAEAIGRRSGPFPEIIRASDDALQRDVEAGAALWDVVAERFAGGHVAAAVSLAVAAAEVYPHAAGATAAVRRAHDTQSPFLAALGRYVEALSMDDGARLAECVDDFRARRATLYAVKAGIARARLLRERGDLAGSVRQAEAAWTLAGEHGPAPVGLFAPLGRAVGLSAREREIAALLTDGMTSQTIADTLGLGYHTVENYLSSAYRKLGSTGRADLIRAVTTWASQ